VGRFGAGDLNHEGTKARRSRLSFADLFGAPDGLLDGKRVNGPPSGAHVSKRATRPSAPTVQIIG
jgi:hypothetical protein